MEWYETKSDKMRRTNTRSDSTGTGRDETEGFLFPARTDL